MSAPRAGVAQPRAPRAWLQRQWWTPVTLPAVRALAPLAALYRAAAAARLRAAPRPDPLPVPVIVVGNVVVGGAGKTPTVIALVQALQRRGYRPGVVSRGYGRRDGTWRQVQPGDDPREVGDEPLLVCRRTGVPVAVGADRPAAVRRLCEAEPSLDVVVSDDGLQHHALSRQVEIVVFDERGAGNGRLLPAGPLREPLHGFPGHTGHGTPVPRHVLYTGGRASTALPGAVARRHVGRAWPLAAWWTGAEDAAVDLVHWQGAKLAAMAGLGAPSKFFDSLRAAGLRGFVEIPLPDHHAHRRTPWPADVDVLLTTEKDAVKLPPPGPARPAVWVVPLDLALPEGWLDSVLAPLPAPAAGRRRPT